MSAMMIETTPPAAAAPELVDPPDAIISTPTTSISTQITIPKPFSSITPRTPGGAFLNPLGGSPAMYPAGYCPCGPPYCAPYGPGGGAYWPGWPYPGGGGGA